MRGQSSRKTTVPSVNGLLPSSKAAGHKGARNWLLNTYVPMVVC